MRPDKAEKKALWGGEEKLNQKSENRDGMRIDWNIPITMDDGIVLAGGRLPACRRWALPGDPDIRGLCERPFLPGGLSHAVAENGSRASGDSRRFDQQVPGLGGHRPRAVGSSRVRGGARGLAGAGCSPGFLDPQCPREDDDLYQCIEWAGTQLWSNGKVGMLGISYYAINQWHVAAKHPPHLTAIIPWEGFNDNYRDPTYHGGILSEFTKRWSTIQVFTVQHGLGERAKKNPNTGESIAGPVTLSDEEMAKNRIDPFIQTKAHPLDDEWHRQRSADLSKITTPFLSCANWGGQGIHPRGNFNGFTEAPAKQKWLEVHGDTHWSLFSSGYGVALQKRFFDYFLKGIENGWDKEPRVQLNIRYPGEKFVLRMENEWPIARTQWTRFYLDPSRMILSRDPVAQLSQVEYEALGKGVTFTTPPLEHETEITGPIAAKLFISSSTRDADLFLIVRVFDPNGKELTFQGALDPNTPDRPRVASGLPPST